MKYKLTVYEPDGSITYETKDVNELIKLLESHRDDELNDSNKQIQKEEHEFIHHRESMYEHHRRLVYATGNRWAIENFHATHG